MGYRFQSFGSGKASSQIVNFTTEALWYVALNLLAAKVSVNDLDQRGQSGVNKAPSKG